jgi:transposase, IS30 family
VPVSEAAEGLGISRQRCYTILQVMGRPRGVPRPASREPDPAQVVAVFTATGSINRAAKTTGVTHWVARRVLVERGLVSKDRQPHRKAAARARLLELLGQGWSVARAAREVGVQVRTARLWRDDIGHSGNTRARPEAVVTGYGTAGRYTQSVHTTESRAAAAGVAAVHDRYLSLPDRLVIADGVINGRSLTQIGAQIGKHKSTVSREVRAHSVEGLYLPYHAERSATAARARPKQSKLVTNHTLRQAVEDGLSQRWSPEEISHRLVKDFPDDEGMRVSHETIYQAVYFQARGGLKRELTQALRSGRTKPKPHRHPDQRTHRFIDPMIMISERPAEVEDRAVPGHWESQWCCQAA